MALVVSDTSPLRALQHLGLLGLLNELFGEVLIPPAVASELTNRSAGVPPLDPGAVAGLRVQGPTDAALLGELRARLDPGEAEALCLAVEVGAAAVLIDEAAGRKQAARMGLNVVGVLGILLRAKREGRIPAVGPLITHLEQGLDFACSKVLREHVMREAGESP